MKRLSAFIIFCAFLTGCAANKAETAETSGTLLTSERTTAAAETEELSEKTFAVTEAAETETTTDTETEETANPPETVSKSTLKTAAASAETTVSSSAETKAVTTSEMTSAPAETAVTTISERQTAAPESAVTSAEKTTSAKKTEETTPEALTSTEETTSAQTTAETAEETTAVTYSEAVEMRADGSLLVFGEEYVPTFDDEFSGTDLDLTKWSRCPEQKRQDLNCYWEDDCSYLNGKGQLVLEAVYDGDFLMGGIRSKGKFEQAYGYFEVKCTLNTTPGWWTAFWLMGESVMSEENGGVDGTEIDIYESAYFKDSAVQHTLNWDGYGAAHKALGSVAKKDGLYDGGYHTFSLLWTPEEYVYFVDGEETWRTDAAEAEGVCTVPLYLKMTAETGSWTFADMDETLLPDSILVDYIRVYEKSE